MTFLLVPISLFNKVIVSGVPGIMNTIPIYLFAVIFFLQIKSKKVYLNDFTVSRKVYIFFTVSALAQIATAFRSLFITTENSTISVNIVSNVGNMLVTFLAIVFYYYFAGAVFTSDKMVNRFLQSGIVTLIVLYVLVIIPQIITTFSPILDGWINFIGKLFEERHPGNNYFYANGSYATTEHRVNGFSPEASFFAAMIGIIFIPLLLSAIRNRYDVFKKRFSRNSYYGLLFVTLIILLFARTTTGFLVVFLTIALLVFSVHGRERIVVLSTLCIGLIMVIMLYIANTTFQNLVNSYLLQKQGTDNRMGGTIALFRIFLKYPILGVGSAIDYFMFKLVPISTTNNLEFYSNFLPSQSYPVQSIWGEFFAYFGLIVMIPVLIYLVKKVKVAVNLRKWLREDGKSYSQGGLYVYVIDAFLYTLVFFAVLACFSFSWTESYYLLFYSFYIVIINKLLKKKKGLS